MVVATPVKWVSGSNISVLVALKLLSEELFHIEGCMRTVYGRSLFTVRLGGGIYSEINV